MELIIDNNFKEAYSLYFGDLRSKVVLDIINGLFSNYDPEIVAEAINIVKTAMTVGFTYTECYDKIVEIILPRFPLNDDIDKFVVGLVVKIMVAAESSVLDDILRSPRDINREIAAKHFRVPLKKVTDKMVVEIVAALRSLRKLVTR